MRSLMPVENRTDRLHTQHNTTLVNIPSSTFYFPWSASYDRSMHQSDEIAPNLPH
jgi:hypothetical protein